MFSHIYQSGFLSLFYSEGGHPLEIWQAISPSPLPASVTEANGTNNCSSEDLDATIQFTDDDMIHGRVLQLWSSDSRAVYIMCPARLVNP
ncbi:hypothetical protein BDF19DRAFT_422114 [Syncephalis fuscata]|nr:hypothetical protein BDF19DRAFT_422114 [Syncephalis fuscata]